MIQIPQLPIKKYIYYVITTVLKAMDGGFHNTPFQLTTKAWFNRAKPNPQLSDMTSY